MSGPAPWLRRIAPTALGAATVALFYGRLALPGRVFAARDMAFLHLPLRTNFQRLLAGGLPGWDPWVHGGQPLLSNPHYAAWYPTTWLFVWLPPYLATQWAILLHAALAFAGAWRLARRWGCGGAAAAFAAIAYAGGGYFAGLPSLLLIFFGMAWWPWVMLAADRALRTDVQLENSLRVRAVLSWAALLALQALNGDPASLLASALGCLALAWDAHRAGAAPWRRLTAGLALAIALAAIQIVPSFMRLRESSRGTGLEESEAAAWSTRPLRLVETISPRLFGDPVRDEEDLYFGWRLHDREYPLLLSIYPGLLVTVLGGAALLRGGIPRRAALATGAVAGLVLGLGRHEPLWPLLHRLVPFLGQLRYPEKFLLVALGCLTFAAALELERQFAARRHDAPGRRPSFAPVTLAVMCLAAAAIVAVLYAAAPEAAANFVRSHSGAPPTDLAVVRGVAYLRREALWTLAIAAASLGALAATGSRVPARWAATLVIAVLAVDLAAHSRGLNPTMALADFERAAPLAQQVPAGARVVSEADILPSPPVGLRIGPPGEQQLRARLARLEPLSVPLWGRAEVLERDYDLTLTSWGRWARRLLRDEWSNPARVGHLLDAWSVVARIQPRPPQEVVAELRAGNAQPVLARLVGNASALPLFRSISEAAFYPDLAAASGAARERDFDVRAREDLVGVRAGSGQFSTVAVEAPTLGSRVTLALEWPEAPRAAALVVAAITFDDGWSASTASGALPTWPTALGQLAFEVPPGSSRVELRYRDPWVRVGALVSILACLALALAASRTRRIRRA